MANKKQQELDSDICAMICPISAGMVGVCMTTIGLIRVVITINKADSFADNLLAVDAVLFLISTLTAYIALRTRSVKRLHTLEQVADMTFIMGMILMVFVCLFISYEIA